MLEAAACLSYWRAAGAIETSKLGFRKGSPGGKLTLDDVLTELAVERFHYAFHYDSTKEELAVYCTGSPRINVLRLRKLY
jgi:hypothetical protein